MFPEAPRAEWLGYNLVYRLVGRPNDVLVVGLNALGMLALLFYTGSFAVLVLSGRMPLTGRPSLRS